MDFENLLKLFRAINRVSVFLALAFAFLLPLLASKGVLFPWRIVWYFFAIAASSGLVELLLSQFPVRPSTTTIFVIIGSGVVGFVLLIWMISVIGKF